MAAAMALQQDLKLAKQKLQEDVFNKRSIYPVKVRFIILFNQ